MIQNFITGIKNLIYYFPVIWSDRDWDWAFLLILMDKKMRKMSKYQKHHGISINHKEYAKELMVAAELCRRISGDHDYEKYLKLKHKKKWGKLKPLPPIYDECYGYIHSLQYENAKTDYQQKKAIEEQFEIMQCKEKRIKFEIDYLFTIMKKKLRT